MPYADNHGVHVHYEVEGEGPPLVLQHGFTDSLRTWYELGYVDALKQDYRLILVDARGHGSSDKPYEPEAYKPECNAADVVSVLTELGISRARFFGYSMGGWIAFAMAKYAPETIGALIIGGANPHPIAPPDPYLPALTQGAAAIPPRRLWHCWYVLNVPMSECVISRGGVVRFALSRAISHSCLVAKTVLAGRNFGTYVHNIQLHEDGVAVIFMSGRHSKSGAFVGV
jgi:pimeloyl-ACP methyl ester carboxylesterase